MGSVPNILIKMEGLPQEGGHLTLNDFLKQLESWKKIITQMSSQDGQADIYYRVVNLSHSSPVTIELEPVRKKVRTKTNGPKRVTSSEIKKRSIRVLREMGAIQKRAQVSEDVDRETLNIMKSLTPSPYNGLASASIRVGDSVVELDQKFSSNLNKLVEGEEHSYGSVEGSLEILNIHGPKFYCCIFPSIGPERIRCSFPPHKKKEIIGAVGHRVRIYGRKHFRGNSPFPYLFDIEEVEQLNQKDLVKLSTLEGVMNGITPETTIQQLRDDW